METHLPNNAYNIIIIKKKGESRNLPQGKILYFRHKNNRAKNFWDEIFLEPGKFLVQKFFLSKKTLGQ